MGSKIEVLRVGPHTARFQVRQGLLFGHVLFGDDDVPDDEMREKMLHDPSVNAVIASWLAENGETVGSPSPPKLTWDEICLRVLVAAG